ncbi:MAG TPA: carboxypeptidase-like regulatory domain-containing protein [Bryobacteraceae bacterium]|jgi:hypothetical protein|nr:carboxypeptidase-like regulatory domain-containing protein [Bryobacteraceae bacterium]
MAAGLAWSQAGTSGTIVGTITDPSGAAVPGVAITITNTDTNAVTQIKSGGNGDYVAADLPVGHYTVKAEAQGFKTAEQTNITLQVGQRLKVDIPLEVGATTESITVEANAVQVQSESGEVSSVITGQQVTQLATNGRSIYSLATIIPGASSNMSDLNVPTSTGGDSTVAFNGLRQNHNLWLIDGGEASDRGGAGGMDVMPSVDAIGEFRALTSNYSSDFGLSSAGTMTMVIKSGTKDFHGTLWEFNRNDALDAANFINNANNVKTPVLRFNTYGFNVGGPVYIPKVYNKNRDRTFFFYNMEWRKLIQGGNVNTTVPWTSAYTGDFSGTGKTIYLPTSAQVGGNSALASALTSATGVALGAPFPGDKIPASLLNKNAQLLLQTGIFPAANGNNNQFVGGSNLPTNVREEIVRIDHRFSDKLSVFGHLILDSVDQTYGTSMWSGDNVPTVGNTFSNPSYHGVVHATWSISPTLLNEVAYNQNGNKINIQPDGIYQRPSGLSVAQLFGTDTRIPSVSLSQLGTNYDVSSWPWTNKADDYQVRDDLSWIKGAHQIKMGASWALYKKVQELFGQTQGAFTFNGQYTGVDFADFLLGLSSSYSELALQDNGYWNNISPAAYIQDNWKVNNRLTLNLGLRWDGIPHTYEAHDRMANFYPGLYNPADAAHLSSDGNSILAGSPGLGTSPNPALAGIPFYLNGIGLEGKNGIPKGLVKDQWLNFGPRIGFAYGLDDSGKTVLRGGFGIMYERIQGNDMYNAGPNQPFSATVTNPNVYLNNPAISVQNGQPVPTTSASVGSITGLAYTDYKSPASYQYSFGLQRQLSGDSVLSVSYVGNENRHQNDYRETNLPPDSQSLRACLIQGLSSCPYNTTLAYLGFHSLKMSENAENGNYNGLQVELRSKIRSDLQLQAAYTFSKAMDPAGSVASFGGDLYTVSDPYNRHYDYGPAGSDRTHIAVINFIYDMPFFRNSQHAFVRTTLGGWELSGIVTAESGLPLQMTLGGSQGSNGIANATNRPNVVGTLTYPHTVSEWFNTSAFGAPALGAWGDLGSGVVRGPGRDNWNVSLFKRFIFSEQHQREFQLRFETYNTFNHTQFNGISTSFSSSNFGQVTSVWDPRVFQLGAKLLF